MTTVEWVKYNCLFVSLCICFPGHILLWEDSIVCSSPWYFCRTHVSFYSSLGSPYDYGSIMHYPSWAFTVNGQDTIIPLRPGGETIGNRAGLSSHDIDQLRLMHQCSTGSRNLNDLTINNLCSVDCKCWEYALGNCDSNDDCMGDAHCGDTPVEFFEGAAAGTVPERMCLTAGLTSRPSMSPSGSRLPSVEPSISNEPTMTMNPTSSPTGRVRYSFCFSCMVYSNRIH